MTDINTIHKLIAAEKNNLFSFLRDIIAIRSFDGDEEAVIRRVASEMESCGFDEVRIDQMGNVIGSIGYGDNAIAFDAHIDTVGTGNLSDWDCDPFLGKEDDEKIWGRGSCDQKGGMASMVYAGKLLKQLGVPEHLKIYFIGTVYEEDYEGFCWQHIIEKEQIHPKAVISTEPTDLQICIGHRGRTDLIVDVQGKTAHGAMPWLGQNAIEKMADIILELNELSARLADDQFLGKGTLNISAIHSNSPSKCAVPDQCLIHIDRRLTFGETPSTAVKEILNLPSVRKYHAQTYVEDATVTSWTGLALHALCEFPAWKMNPSHPLCVSAKEVVRTVTGHFSGFQRWNFSTNGVAINGKYHIPCIGIGPGCESEAHTANEYTSKKQLLDATACYILLIQKLGGTEYEMDH